MLLKSLYGSAFALGGDTLNFYRDCEREAGIVETHVWRLKVFVVTAPELIEEVLLHQHACFMKSAGLRATEKAFGRGLLTSDGTLWKQQRKIMQPAFTAKRVQLYQKHLDAGVDRLLQRYGEGGVRNIYRDMTDLCFEVLAMSLFGDSLEDGRAQVIDAAAALHEFHLEYARWIGHLGGPLFTAIRRVSTALGRPDFVTDPSALPTRFARRFREAIDALDAFAERLIHRRRRAPLGDDLFSMLLSARDAHGQPLTPRQLRDEVVTLFFAGHETGAAALAWALYLLAKNPNAAAQFQREIDRGNGEASATQVFQESLRLYPPAFRISRTVVKDCVVGKTKIPAGAEVILPQWAVHRSAKYYSRPDAFHPERWTPEFTAQLPRFAYFPFGGGPRTCIGNHFALAESHDILERMLSLFQLSVIQDDKPDPMLGVTMIPRHGKLMLHVTPRNMPSTSANRQQHLATI